MGVPSHCGSKPNGQNPVDGAKSKSPVENGGRLGRHPIIYMVSTCFNHASRVMQDFAGPSTVSQ